MSKRKILRNFRVPAALVLCAVAILYYCTVVHIPPFKSLGVKSLGVTQLGYVTLGMRKVDVTLFFGRKPDCPQEEDNIEGNMIYQGGPGDFYLPGFACPYYISFEDGGERDGRVNKICYKQNGYAYMKYEWPRNIWSEYYSVDEDEKSLTGTFGEPSFVSIDENGIDKIINYSDYNAAFIIRSGKVIEACISDALPLRYINEYGDK